MCDHFRATDYFIDSLSPNCTHAMEGFPCSNADDFDRGRCLKCNGTCPIMGYKAEKSKNHQIHGSHYLYTAKSSPFCGKCQLVSFMLLTLSLPECLIEFCKVTLTSESVDEIL